MTYKVGDWVEVLSPAEIMQTLDDKGALDNMPFMPEMLQFAGRRLRVSASAHKACDTIDSYQNRRVESAVHLGVRCDGSAHGGCQTACLLYWKTAWVKPVEGPALGPALVNRRLDGVDTSVVDQATHECGSDPIDGRIRYSCQATRLVESSFPLRKTDVRQYWKDLTSGNVSLWTMIRFMTLAVYNTIVSKLGVGRQFPSIKGLAGRKTPSDVLDLQPGELVEVKSAEEIMKTLDVNGKNRGMFFDTEMLPFCGKQYRVKQRASQVIDEKTGLMMTMKTPGIILEDVVCNGCLHANRIFCPRGFYCFWREIWLKRVQENNADRLPSVTVAANAATAESSVAPAS